MSSLRGLALRASPILAFGLLFAIAPVATEAAWPVDVGPWLLLAGIKATFFFIGMSVFCRVSLDLLGANTTAYAVTDRRILIVRRWPDERVRSVYPEMINAIEHRVHSDGSGSVFYRKHDEHGLEASGVVKSGFVAVQDVLGAVRALEQLRVRSAV